VLPGVAHHVTQRGNARRFILQSDTDRLVYLRLLQQYARLHQLALVGYCLMSNHVHLIAIPRRADSLALALRQTHGQYAAYLNAREGSSGHVWQGRYYSCPLDMPHLWAALRYTERNPVRARVVSHAELYQWSSAAAHCGMPGGSLPIESAPWQDEWTASAWHEFLRGDEAEAETQAIRASTHTGRPLGSSDFVHEAEVALRRTLMPRKGGRPSRRAEFLRHCARYFIGGE
jgi:putative transposase